MSESELEEETFVKNLENEIEQEMGKFDVKIKRPEQEIKIPEINIPQQTQAQTQQVKPAETFSPGYSITYCMECISKHLAAAQKLAEEAFTFSRNNECSKSIGWIRDILKELAGMEVDVKPDAPKELLEIVDKARNIRRNISASKLEYLCNTDEVKKISDQIIALREDFYRTSSNLV